MKINKNISGIIYIMTCMPGICCCPVFVISMLNLVYAMLVMVINKQNKLMKDKKKKEQFKDPVDKLLKRSAVNATFSNDVKRESSPAVLIFVAAAIAAIAVMLGIRGLIDRKRNGESDEI